MIWGGNTLRLRLKTNQKCARWKVTRTSPALGEQPLAACWDWDADISQQITTYQAETRDVTWLFPPKKCSCFRNAGIYALTDQWLFLMLTSVYKPSALENQGLSQLLSMLCCFISLVFTVKKCFYKNLIFFCATSSLLPPTARRLLLNADLSKTLYILYSYYCLSFIFRCCFIWCCYYYYFLLCHFYTYLVKHYCVSVYLFCVNCVNGATNEQVSARTECSERF